MKKQMKQVNQVKSDQEVLDVVLDLLNHPKYGKDSKSQKIRNALKVVALRAFERSMMTHEDLTHEEWWELANNHNKLQAVRLFGTRTGASLMESKRFIETQMENRWGFTHFHKVNLTERDLMLE